MISFFDRKVYKKTKEIPLGRVSTYGLIAIAIDNPRSARAVGNSLHKNPFAPVVPCHRVVNYKGFLAENFGDQGKEGQRKKLKSEGIVFKKTYQVDLEKSLYKF